MIAQQRAETGSQQESPGITSSIDARSAYALHLKPKLAHLLSAFKLDVIFHRAEGDWLYYYDEHGSEIAVLDIIGGFGASLFGHNHPDLIATASRVMKERRPFNAQASVRAPAALLARQLSESIGRTTNRSYVVTLANSGTEAVEAAIKHAELRRFRRNESILDRLDEDRRRLRIGLREQLLQLTDDFFDKAEQLLGQRYVHLDALLEQMHTQAQKALQVSPRFLAIEEGFHGKSTGSLKLTHREEFRRPWTHIGISVTFVARENIQALQATVESERVSYPALFFAGDGSVGIGLREVNTIAACFCEPIQGEGGIHKLSPAFLTALRTTATDEDFPLIFDEIQCGMGRCGTFLASEASGVRGDYYLLSKSLGGGLVKLAALVVDSAHYEYDFSYLHTSTFADDDLSSCVALRALELVEEDERSLVRECGRKGEWLRDRLRQLQESYPGQIRDVRGQGLMIGVELKPQHSSSSPLLRVLSEQNLLCYLAAGYLLRVHGIRIAPTLAHRTVLRIEPSAYISPGSLETFCLALERFLLLLRSADVARLLAFVIEGSIDDAVGTSLPEVTIEPGRSQILLTENRKRVGFLVNFTGPRDLQAWEPALLRFRESDCEAFLDRTHGLLDPFILDETEIRSSRNDCVDVVLIGVPFTPTQAIAGMRQGDDQCASMVRKAVLMARERGCSVVGLGGHTSIVTDSGRSLIEDRINLTTGNSLTVAAAVEALLEVAHRRGLRPRSCHLGVVGAAGNVGATLAELLAEQVGSLVLVGRACSSRFLSPVAYRIYENAYEALRLGSPSGSIASAIERLPSIQALLKKNESCSGQFIAEEMIRDRGDATPVRIAESMAALQECQLIITATNAPSPVLKPQHVGDHDVVICDVAIPQDVSPTMEIEKPRAVVIRGGILRAPLGQRLDIPALRLPGSELYGCLAETIVLGFAEYNGHYSYGRISAERVRQVKGWALAHGFEVSGS